MKVICRWLGIKALAAISASFPIYYFLISFTIGIGPGGAILIGKAFGSLDADRLKAVVGTTRTFTFVIGVFLAVNGIRLEKRASGNTEKFSGFKV